MTYDVSVARGVTILDNAIRGQLADGNDVTTQCPNHTEAQPQSAVEVPTSAGYDGATTTWMILTDDLPLLDPPRSIPVIEPVLSDLLQPAMELPVNLGYGDPDYGWVNADANVAAPLELFPSLADPQKVPALLVTGTEEGIQNAVSDLENPSQLFSPAGNPQLSLIETPYLSAMASQDLSVPPPTDTLAGIVNAFSDAASNRYGALLPTADIADAVATSFPAEDVSIFAYELGQGDLVDAAGLLIADDMGLASLAGLFEIGAVGERARFAGLDFVSPFVDLSSLIP